MSSNTLRGIGQKGDGEGATDPATGAPEAGAQPASAGQGADPNAQPSAAGAAERMPDVRKIRSLDSTVPGTRSLDSSVPDASPSLDGRVPSLAATMMGMTAPSIPGRNSADNGRDKGTVQGRDVHLPVEMQRRAGVIPVAGADAVPRSDAAPQEIDHAEPTIAEPVRVLHGAPEANSHGPWYEQEPVGADAYDDPRPNLIGRVAIGAAIAASLSVVLFAIVRVRAQGQAAQEAEPVAPITRPAPPTANAANAAPPAPVPAVPDEALAPDRPTGVVGWDNPPEVEVPPEIATAPRKAPARPAALRPAVGSNRPAAPSAGPRPSSAGPGPRAAAAAIAPLPNNLFRPKALGEAPPERTPLEPAAAGLAPPPLGTGAGPATTPAAIAPPPAATGAAAASPPLDAPSSPRPKGKTYDPDSTLPLNAE